MLEVNYTLYIFNNLLLGGVPWAPKTAGLGIGNGFQVFYY